MYFCVRKEMGGSIYAGRGLLAPNFFTCGRIKPWVGRNVCKASAKEVLSFDSFPLGDLLKKLRDVQ